MIFLWVPVINLNLDGTGPRIVDVDMAGAGGATSAIDSTRLASASMAGSSGATASADPDTIPAPVPPPPLIYIPGGGGGGGGGAIRWYEPPEIIRAGRIVDVSMAARGGAIASLEADAIKAPPIEIQYPGPDTVEAPLAVPEPRIVDVGLAARSSSRAAADAGRIVSVSMRGLARSRGYARASLALIGPAGLVGLARPVGPIRRVKVRS